MPSVNLLSCDSESSESGTPVAPLGTELLAWVQDHAPALRDRFAIMTGGALTPGARASLGQAEVPVLYQPVGREAVLALLSQLVSATP